MSTPPGEGDQASNQPGQDPWSWEHSPEPESAPPADPFGATLPPSDAPAPEQAPPAGLAWDTPPSPGDPAPPPPQNDPGPPALQTDATPEPPAADNWAAQLPDSLAQPESPPATAPAWTPPPAEHYPTRFDVAYPERLSRWKTLLRIFLFVPVFLAGALIAQLVYAGVFVGYMTVFWKKKYPDWLFRGNAGGMGFLARSGAYALLVTDRFPSFAPEDSPVTLDFDQPPSGQLSRWRVIIWKSVLLFPMAFVLWFLWLAVMVTTFLAWFGILFTGNYPRGLFGFSVGVQRWQWRLWSYQASFNDRYPPYALSASAGPGSSSSVVINGVIGGLISAGYAAIIVAAIVAANKHETEQVNYAQLLAGRAQVSNSFDTSSGDRATLRLNQAFDPGDDHIQVLRPARGERIVVVRWTVVNSTGLSRTVAGDAARIEYRYSDDGKTKTKGEDAVLIGVNDVTAPASIRSGGTAVIQAVFIIPDDAEPTALWFHHGFAQGGVKYELK
mgnify:CR=1 FL=1